MEEALFEEKERAQVTLRSIGDGVVCADIHGNITFLNLVAETHHWLVVPGGDRTSDG
jgi:PAS domain-containing protein